VPAPGMTSLSRSTLIHGGSIWIGAGTKPPLSSAQHQSGRALDPRVRPHALGCRDDEGRVPADRVPERDDSSGNHALSPPEAALVRPGGLMPQTLSPSISVTASASPRDRIVLLEGHGVECDAHAGPFVGHLIWPTRGCRPYASGPDVALARSDAKGQGGSGGKPRTSRTGPNERL
jgi:hypothetical protein